MDQPLITPTLVSESIRNVSPTLLYRESIMDPWIHTTLAMSLLYSFYKVGQMLGKQNGIESTLIFLINNGVCTPEDLHKVNERINEER